MAEKTIENNLLDLIAYGKTRGFSFAGLVATILLVGGVLAAIPTAGFSLFFTVAGWEIYKILLTLRFTI
ncbi:hypothetical protein Lgra_2214 [Legionella gratiana]|uniref:Transmembrane protein n=1 Tax=Legionella gratiana TaxID=45066 RepID=A0A378JFP5_9GAMM|nr:hypothetical protein [Legionella gratiana]KTD08979.1 hypothetical protein Lgra_2214 [Legionella gratiana]STX45808.1 Uncharacterised protein [Legionella gratiana]